MPIDIEIRDATGADGGAMLALLPRLADFELPAHREARDLWQHDAELLRRWLDGEAMRCLAQVAVHERTVVGFTLVSLRPDRLSDEPSAHLEVIVLAADAEGIGAGKLLLQAAERNAGAHGAVSMTLHVIATNRRACGFYEHSGYRSEMLRYFKPLSATRSEQEQGERGA